MSVYGYLVCTQCRVCLWLGRAYWHDVLSGDRRVSHYGQGGRDHGPPWRNVENRVLWKFLADHAGHSLRPMPEDKWEHLVQQAVERHGDSLDVVVSVDHDVDDGFNVTEETYLEGLPG